MKLNVKRLTPTARLPFRATDCSAGADVFADLPEPVTLLPGARRAVPTGIAVAPEAPGFGIFAFARSGLACRHGLMPANGVGVIDADYRGEVVIWLVNLGDEPYTIQPGERIAQLVVLPVEYCEIVDAQTLPDTRRGSGGFGSTGS